MKEVITPARLVLREMTTNDLPVMREIGYLFNRAYWHNGYPLKLPLLAGVDMPHYIFSVRKYEMESRKPYKTRPI